MRKKILVTALAAISAGTALNAAAQSKTPGQYLEEVVVTAQKREQNLLDVPINISVADQDFLDTVSADDMEEYADFVPGLQIQSQSLNTSSFSLRGVTSDSGRPRVAVFQNGVAVGAPRFGSNFAMYDLERIEVVKGPQATLFGQGALVGGINFLQQGALTDENEGYVRLDAGNEEYLRGEGFYNLAVSDTLAFRVAGLSKTRDGYAPNLLGKDMMGQETTALRGAMHWEPTDAITADLFFNYQEDESTGTQFKSAVHAPAGGDTSPFTAAALNVNDYQFRSELGTERDITSLTARVTIDLNDEWTLTSLTDYRDINSSEAFDADGTAVNLLQFGTIETGKAFSQELRFNFDNGEKVAAFFGVNFYDVSDEQILQLSSDEAALQALNAPALLPIEAFGLTIETVEQAAAALGLLGVPNAENVANIYNPVPVSINGLLGGQTITLIDDYVEQATTLNEHTTYDIFGDYTFHINDKLSLTAGLRYTQETLDSSLRARVIRGNPALGGTANAVDLESATLFVNDFFTTPRSRSYDTDGSLTWRFNAAYALSEEMNLWGALGRGRRPEALSSNEEDISGTGLSVIEEELLDNIEVGLAGRFLDNRLQLSSSVYYGEYTDFQTTKFDLDTGTYVTSNSGNATQYGMEVEGQAFINDYVKVFGSYAYTFAEYDKDSQDTSNPAYDPSQDFSGNRFRMSPENSISFGADFVMQAGDMGEFYFVPTYIWKDDHFFEDDNDALEQQEAFGLLDLKIGFDAASGNWGATLYVENALDEEYIIDAGNTGGDFGIPTVIRGVPQMWGMGVYGRF